MADRDEKSRIWEITVTSADLELIESLSTQPTSDDIQIGRSTSLGAFESIGEIILTLIRDVDVGVLAGLITAYLWEAKQPRSDVPASPIQDLPRENSAPLEPTHITASLSIRHLEKAVTVDLDIETDSKEAAEALITATLRNATLDQ